MSRRLIFQLILAAVMASAVTARAQLLQDLVSVEVSANRAQVYVNEKFQITLSINSMGVSLDQNFQLLSMPDKNKLSFSEFRELPAERRLQGNQIADKRRFVCEARALSPETVEFAPTIRLGIVSGFGLFRQISYNDIKARGLSLPVLPLPESGKPAAFSGAIGQFTLRAEISPDNVAVGDLITVTTTIQGKGHLEPVAAVSIPSAPGFRVYPPKAVPASDSSMKTFEQILVPQSTGALTIPAISFCYFDPTSVTYKTATSGPFAITSHAQRKLTAEAIYRPAQVKPRSPVSKGGAGISADNQKAVKHFFNKKIITAAAYWITITALSILVTLRYKRGSIIAFGILIIAAMTYLPLWSLLQTSGKESFVIRNEKARLAPAYSAVVLFEVSRNSQVRVVDTCGPWSRIEMSEKKGWLPSEALTNAAPANAGSN